MSIFVFAQRPPGRRRAILEAINLAFFVLLLLLANLVDKANAL